MDPFQERSFKPMLTGREEEAFDSPDYFFELKLDGERCLAYLDRGSTVLVNRRGRLLLPQFPELAELHRQSGLRCVLDGELIITRDGKPDFEEVLRRSNLKRKVVIEMAAKRRKADFVAFDLLYLQNKSLLKTPLAERRELLERTVIEGGLLSLSRVVEDEGRAFFEVVRREDLEGIVAKLKSGLYYPGKRTRDWVKIKNVMDDDFVICGYLLKARQVISLVLGQYRLKGEPDPKNPALIQVSGEMLYRGHVVLKSREDFKVISAQPRAERPPFTTAPRPETRPSTGSSPIWSARSASWPTPRPGASGSRPTAACGRIKPPRKPCSSPRPEPFF